MKKILPFSLIGLGLIFLFLAYYPIVKDEIIYQFNQIVGIKYVISNSNNQIPDRNDSIFSSFLGDSVNILDPVNTEFAILIESIGVNAPVIKDVPVSNEKAYNKALKFGVAHSLKSPYPSEDPGNVYLFAHATTNFWDLGKYATVFNLLRKLESRDRINVFFEGRKFEYEVIGKEVLPGWSTYPLTRPVIEPILTLQTCDPPGTTLNRLVVTARLVSVD